MRKLIGILIVGALLSLGQVASAGPYEDGVAAARRGDYATALKLLRPLADQGNARAQFSLGVMYDKGQGVPQDYKEAMRWYRLSAEQGGASAQNNLGAMYKNGEGVAQDSKEAVKWYRLASAQGNARAQFSLGLMYSEGQGVAQDKREAVKWFRLSAEQGHASAQLMLGMMYAGGHGVAQDDKEAVKWLRLSAEQGNAFAQNSVGAMYAKGYATGSGVATDYKEATKWFRLSAEQAFADAHNNLGVMYEWGRGVTQDYVRAHMWFNLAAASFSSGEQSKKATNNRDGLAAKMTPAQIERAQEMSRICQASNYKQCGEPESKPQTASPTPLPAKPKAEPKKTVPPPPAAPQSASRNSPQPTRSSATSVPMKQQGGTFVVPVLINDTITLNFIVDSGAADVTIPSDVVAVMIRTGTLTEKDFGAKRTYILADGSKVESRTFRIRSLKVGDKVVENVMGSEAHVAGALLLGQSFLGKFKSWSIDNTKHALVLE